MKKLTILLFFISLQNFAQKIPPLERLISVRLSNDKIEVALEVISKTGNFTFSYNPTLIETTRRVSLNAQNQPVRDILNLIFVNNVEFKNRGNYIILKKKSEEERKDFFVMGYVLDGETGQKIEKASIYEPTSLASAVTNQYGYYKIKLSTDLNNINLLIRKQEYQGASVSVKSKQDKNLNISLIPIPIPIEVKSALVLPNISIKPLPIRTDTTPNKKLDSIPPIQTPPLSIDTIAITDSKGIKIDPKKEWEEAKETFTEVGDEIWQWFLSKKQSIHQNNIKDTLYRDFQFSLLPYVGTNYGLSGNVINDYSINLLAGYSLGVRKIELGAGVNLVRGYVNGIQAAGIANLVGYSTKGVQAAGFLNLNGKSMYGIQAAGTTNLNLSNGSGVQASGFSNLTLKSFHGIQATGAINYVGGNFRNGVQASGFTNIAMGKMKGVQASGAINYVGNNFDGVQASGFLNTVGDTLRGIQVGIVNYSKVAKNSVQIGVFNFAKKSNGVPIGLLSFVGNGYQRLEVGTDELFPLSVTFKTGVRKFYNIIGASYNFKSNSKTAYQYTYGVGTAFKLNRTFWINADITQSRLQLDHSTINWDTINNHTKLNIGLEAHLSKRIALFIAPSVNLFITEEDTKIGIAENFILSNKSGRWLGKDVSFMTWVGLQGGLRICNR